MPAPVSIRDRSFAAVLNTGSARAPERWGRRALHPRYFSFRSSDLNIRQYTYGSVQIIHFAFIRPIPFCTREGVLRRLRRARNWRSCVCISCCPRLVTGGCCASRPQLLLRILFCFHFHEFLRQIFQREKLGRDVLI